MVNPVLPSPQPTGYGRAANRSPLGNSPSGSMAARSIPRILGYWEAPYGLTPDPGVGFSKQCKSWNAAPGYPGSTFRMENSANSWYWRSRLDYGKYILAAVNSRPAIECYGSTHDVFVAMMVRNRRSWSAADPGAITSQFFFSFTTTAADNPGVWLSQDTGGGVSGYKWNLYDYPGANKYPNGTANTALAQLSVDWTFLALRVAANGDSHIFENGRKLTCSSNMRKSRFTRFCLGRGSQNIGECEIAAVGIWQHSPTDDEVKSLRDNWRMKWGCPQEPTTSVSVTGDSIIAGETYVVSTDWEARSICERAYLQDRRMRILDLTKSSTLFAYGQTVMTNATATDAGAKGGLGFHSSYYNRKIHVIQHGRNDLSSGASLATMQTRCAAAVAQVKAFDSTIRVLLCTVIATPDISVTWPSQDVFNQECINWNAYIRSDYATLGADGYIDFGGESVFAPTVGASPYLNTTWYHSDTVHPNGTAGADRMTEVFVRDIRPHLL